MMMMNRPLPPADLLNDPAFSPDPTLHPAHVSSHTVLTVPPGHPRFRQDRLATLAAAASRPPLPPIAVSRYSRRNDWDTDPFLESLPLQPPNTPQADGPVFQKQYTLRSDALMHEAVPSHRPPQMIQQLHESPASPSSSSSHMSSPSTTPPSSASSHYPNPIKNDPTMMPTTTSELPSATNVPPVIPTTKADKRSRTFSFFRRKQPQPPQPAQPQPRSPTKAKLTKAAPSKPIPTQSDPPRSASPPQPGRVQSAPEFGQTESRPLPPQRSATAPSPAPYPASAQPTPALSKPVQLLGLDRIDELDETNPFGARVHHGGPYEAIARLVGAGTQPDPLGLPDQSHKAHMNTIMQVGNGPSSVSQSTSFSLNIRPGQIVPREFSYGMAPLHPNLQANPPGNHNRQGQNRRGPNSEAGHGPRSRHRPTNPPTSDNLQPKPAIQRSYQSTGPVPPPPPPSSQPFPRASVAPVNLNPQPWANPPPPPISPPEFDPYASYSPTAVPRKLDDEPSPPPLAMPEAPPPIRPKSPPKPVEKPVSKPESSNDQPPSSTLLVPPPAYSKPASPTPSFTALQSEAYAGIADAGSDVEATQDQMSKTPEKPAPAVENPLPGPKTPQPEQPVHLDVKAEVPPPQQPMQREEIASAQPTISDERLVPPQMPRGFPGVPASSSSSVRTGVSRNNRGPPPKTSHLPKKLVMPAPLQQSQNQNLLPPGAGYKPPSYAQPSRYRAPQRYTNSQQYPPPPPPQHHVPPSDLRYEAGALPEREHIHFPPAPPPPEPQHPFNAREHFLRSPPPPTQSHPPFHADPRHHQHQFPNQPPLHPPNAQRLEPPPHTPDNQYLGNDPLRHGSVVAGHPINAGNPPHDRRLLRKKSASGSKDQAFPTWSNEPLPGMPPSRPGMNQMPTKEQLKMEKKERERELKEQKEREKLRLKEEKAMNQKIPKRVLSKRRNDL